MTLQNLGFLLEILDEKLELLQNKNNRKRTKS